MNLKVNDFVENEGFATAPAVTDLLEQFYVNLFPDSNVQRIDGTGILEGQLQKDGIDVVLRLSNGSTIYVDEKIRREDYGDILLEEYSNWEARVPGWLEAQKRTDYIAYMIWSTKAIYFLPYPTLRLAYLQNKEMWLAKYERRFAPNRGYNTSNIPVPWEEFWEALNRACTYSLNY